MSILVRSIVVAVALFGGISAASAGSYGWSGYGSAAPTPAPMQGKWKHDARAFFDQLRKNGN